MIDVIIPAYNAHKTIRQTLLSISLQTIKDELNVYIVNDGSDNDYREEVKLFSKVLNISELKLKKNCGPGVARQYGIAHSKGDYIVFIDSDDMFVDCFSLNSLYEEIKNKDADMVWGSIIFEKEDGEQIYTEHQGCLHAKMYKRKFIKKNKIIFNNSYTNEDNAFNQLFLLADPKVSSIETEVYFYRDNKESITRMDKEFLFYDMKSYVENMVWVLEQGEKRKYLPCRMAVLVYTTLFYAYVIYIKNYLKGDKNKIFEWCKSLLKYYDEYLDVLTAEEIFNIYKRFNITNMAKITFNDFLLLLISDTNA